MIDTIDSEANVTHHHSKQTNTNNVIDDQENKLNVFAWSRIVTNSLEVRL